VDSLSVQVSCRNASGSGHRHAYVFAFEIFNVLGQQKSFPASSGTSQENIATQFQNIQYRLLIHRQDDE
jgi:hypothetical protein